MTTSNKNIHTRKSSFVGGFYARLLTFMLKTRKAHPIYVGKIHAYRPCPRCSNRAGLVFQAEDAWYLACPNCKKISSRPVEPAADEVADCHGCESGEPFDVLVSSEEDEDETAKAIKAISGIIGLC
jgi:hypothetical protein